MLRGIPSSVVGRSSMSFAAILRLNPHLVASCHTVLRALLAGRAPDSFPLTHETLHVLMLPDFERTDRIGEFWSYPQSRTFAELLIDCEEDRTLRSVLVGMLREAERRS
jgi:hypothetical protein